MEGCQVWSNSGLALGLRPCRCTVVGVEQGLTLQQHAGDPEQTVGDAAQGPALRVTTRPQGLIAAAACAVDLHGEAGPVNYRPAQPDTSGRPHDDNPRLTTTHVLPL